MSMAPLTREIRGRPGAQLSREATSSCSSREVMASRVSLSVGGPVFILHHGLPEEGLGSHSSCLPAPSRLSPYLLSELKA